MTDDYYMQDVLEETFCLVKISPHMNIKLCLFWHFLVQPPTSHILGPIVLRSVVFYPLLLALTCIVSTG